MPKVRQRRRKVKACKMCQMNVEYVDYKDIRVLKDFLNEKGKILPRRLTGNCAKHQRMVKDAIKRARQMALIPYIKY
ncbi:30S ribosomal protein S18 [Fervidobacterium sp.]